MKKVLAVLSLAAAVTACEPTTAPVAPGSGPTSSALQVSNDDKMLVIAAEDHDQVLIVDRESREVLHRVDVADSPSQVLITKAGQALVTTRYGGTMHVIDVATGKVAKTISLGVEPTGLAEVSPGRIAVAMSGEQAVALVDLNAGEVTQRIALADPDPRAVAVLKDGSLYVTHMATGTLSRVDLEAGTARTVRATTENQFGPSLHAEHLRSITVSPDQDAVILANTQANTDTVRAPIGEVDPNGGSACGYSGCPTELGAVTPGITEIDTETDVVLVPQPASPETTQGGMNGGMATDQAMSDCFDCGGFFIQQAPNPPSVLNPFESRLGGGQQLPLNNPTAVALVDGGKGQLLVNMGSKNALLLRRDLKGTADDVVGFINLGNGAIGLDLTNDGSKAYVWNQFDGSVSEIDVPDMGSDVGGASKFVPDQNGKPVSAEFKAIPELAAKTFSVVEDALNVDASLGRKLFFDATDTRISAERTVSCGTCHPDGRTDGRTWQFTFGPRNTPQLGGGILDTAPFHWPGDVVNVPDLNRLTVLPFMGGTGLDEQSFTKVAAFIDTIRPAPSVAASQDGLNEAQLRGKDLFEDPAVGCTSCHAGDHFTDNLNHDVATKADMRDIATFQTPVLHGLGRSAPYLHDGSAPTLEALVRNVVATDRMGTGSHLSDGELQDLAEYLKTL